MLNLLLSVLAIFLLAIGILLLISPIPVGVVFIAVSLSILLCVNNTARAWVKNLRRRYVWVNNKFHQLENKIEVRFALLWHAFVETRPPNQSNPKNDDSKD